MRRRDLIKVVACSAIPWPLVARAQQSNRVRRIGVLMNGASTEASRQSWVAAFNQALRGLGWAEGQNIRVDIRWNAGDAQLARIYAAQLIGLMPDVILASSTINLRVIQEATNTVPVVFVLVSDPVEQGFVASLTKPGGNLTGFSLFEFSIGAKWLDLLKKVAPSVDRVAVMFNPATSPQSKFFMRSIEVAAPSRGIQPIVAAVHTVDDIEPAFESFARTPNGALILPTDTFTNEHKNRIIELAGRHRLPSISANEVFPKYGALMYYGINFLRQFQQAADYVDRILKGVKPGDLPVQNPDKYSLIINLKTAKMLGLDVPPSLLAVADEVID
jgi:putative tryptophan/tyrosine transport system substrate-binding protein